MKRVKIIICSSVLLLFSTLMHGQFDGIYLEGVFMDTSVVTVTFQNTIYSEGNSTYYQEEQSVVIDGSGKWWMTVGAGTATGPSLLASFNQIDYKLDSLGMTVEVDFGSGYVGLSDKEFVTVPYALHSRTNAESLAVLAPLDDVDSSGLINDYAFSWNGSNWIVIPNSSLTANYALESDSSATSDTANYAFNSSISFEDTLQFSWYNDTANYSPISGQNLFADSSGYADTVGFSNSGNGLSLDGNIMNSAHYFGSLNNYPVQIRTNGINSVFIGTSGEFEIGSADSLSSFFSNGVDGMKVVGGFGTGDHLNLSFGDYLYYSPDKATLLSGYVSDTLWDTSNVGIYNFVHGRDCWVRGSYSSAFGDSSFVTPIPGVSLSPGIWSLAVGKNCGASGAYSFAVGYKSWAKTNRSFAMGYECSAPYGYSCSAIGYRVIADGGLEPCMAIGNNLLADGNNCTLFGSNVDATGRRGIFMYGDNSTTDTLRPQTISYHQFVTRAAGGVIFYTDSFATMGVEIFPGGGAWATISDSTKKTNKILLGPDYIRNRINRLEVLSWKYKSQDSSILHIGPMAQDFYNAFAIGSSDTTITTTDIDGVTLLGIKDLGISYRLIEERIKAVPVTVDINFDQVDARLKEIERVLNINK